MKGEKQKAKNVKKKTRKTEDRSESRGRLADGWCWSPAVGAAD